MVAMRSYPELTEQVENIGRSESVAFLCEAFLQGTTKYVMQFAD